MEFVLDDLQVAEVNGRAVAEALDICVGNPRRIGTSFSRRVVSSH